MSWQAYVDTNLVGSGKVSQAAIIGLQGGVWANSPGLNISKEEQDAILKAFKNPGTVQATGLRLGGQKYFTLNEQLDRSIYVKKGGDGATLVKTKQAVLVAIYTAPVQGPESAPVVEGLADYLISVNY